MKIAIINYSSSGLWHYAACLANSLAQNQANQILVLTAKQNNQTLIANRPNLELFSQAAPHNLPGFWRWLLSPREQIMLYRTVKNFKPDIIHLTDSHAVCVPHSWWLRRYNIVFTQHDPVPHSGDVFPLASRTIHRVQQKIASKIIVHGRYLKKILVKMRHLPADKIEIIPHGDFSFFARWQKPNYKKIPGSVLFFGRIVDYKGLDILLEAIIKLQRQSIPITLVLAGAGELNKYQELLRQIISKQIINKVIPESEIIHLFKICTVLALPYREASQSGIISIAMPAKIPIVATRVGALPELLEHRINALLVPPRDVSALTDALKQALLSPGLRAKLVAGGLETMKTKTSWSHISKQYYQIYQSLR